MKKFEARRFWVRLLQVIGTIGLLTWLFWQVDLSQLGQVVDSLSWGWVGLGLVCAFASHLVNVARWSCLLPRGAVPAKRLLTYYGAGLFGNSVLPTGVGGDILRAALLRRDVSTSLSIFSVALDRIMGFAALFVFLGIGLAWGSPFDLQLPPALALNRSLILGGLLISGVLIGGLFGLPAFRARLLAAARRLIPENFLPGVATIGLGFLFVAYLLAVLSQGCVVAMNWALLRAVAVNPPLLASMWLTVFSSLTLLIPITISGLGMQESVYVYTLSQYGLSSATSFGVALLVRLFIIIPSVLGGLFSIIRKAR